MLRVSRLASAPSTTRDATFRRTACPTVGEHARETRAPGNRVGGTTARSPEAEALLIKSARNDPDASVRERAVRSLASIETETAVAALATILNASDLLAPATCGSQRCSWRSLGRDRRAQPHQLHQA